MKDSGGPDSGKWKPRTRMVRAGTTRTPFDETCEALFLTSGYVYGTAREAEESFSGERERFVYSRFRNPTVAAFEERLAAIEGAAHCRSTASGMAAVHASLACLLNAGDRMVSARALFGSCYQIAANILPRFGIKTDFVDGKDLDQWKAALSTPAKVVFLETPSNPTMEIIDLAAVCDMAHKAGAKVVVDNVFATPVLQNPLEMGADVVAYSATKHIDGQGRCLGGAILADDAEYVEDKLAPYLRHTGPCLSPFNAWLLLKGLETLDLRIARHCENALAVARFLEGHPSVARVIYPGLSTHPQHTLALRQMKAGGTIVSFELSGGREAAFTAMDALELVDISNNLGDAKSLCCHPLTTTHQSLEQEVKDAMGITPGLVRLSVGLEDVEDIIADLDQALSAAATV